MLYFIACASIAAYMAYWLRPRLLKLPLLAVLGGMVGGLFIGSVLVFGVLSAFGVALVKSEIPRAFGQAFWWCLIAAVAGYVAGKASKASDKWMNVGAIVRMNVGAIVIVAALVLAVASSRTPVASPPTEQAAVQSVASNPSYREPSADEIRIEQLVLDKVRPGWRETVSSSEFNSWVENLNAAEKQRYQQSVRAEDFARFLDAFNRRNSAQQLPNTDRDGKPCTQVTEFLGDCKRQTQ